MSREDTTAWMQEVERIRRQSRGVQSDDSHGWTVRMYVQQIRERRCSAWTSVAYMEVGKGREQESDC